MRWCFLFDALPSSAPSDKEARFIFRSSVILFLFSPFSAFFSPPFLLLSLLLFRPAVSMISERSRSGRKRSPLPFFRGPPLPPVRSLSSLRTSICPRLLSSTPSFHSLCLFSPPPSLSPSLLRPWTVMPGVFKNEAEDFPQSFFLFFYRAAPHEHTPGCQTRLYNGLKCPEEAGPAGGVREGK